MIIRVSLHSEELLVKMCQTVFFFDWASGVKPSIKLISASTSGMKPQNMVSIGFTSTSLFCQTLFQDSFSFIRKTASPEKLIHQLF